MRGRLECIIAIWGAMWAGEQRRQEGGPFDQVLPFLQWSGFKVTDSGAPSNTGQVIINQLSAHGSSIEPKMYIIDDSLDVLLAEHENLEGPARYNQWPLVFIRIRDRVIIPVHSDRSKWEHVVTRMHHFGAKYIERSENAPSQTIRRIEWIRSAIQRYKTENGRLPDFTGQWGDLVERDYLSRLCVKNPLADYSVASRIETIVQPGQDGSAISPARAGWVWNRADAKIYPAGWTEEQLVAVDKQLRERSLGARLNQFNDRRRKDLRTVVGLWRGNIVTWKFNAGLDRFPTIDELRRGDILRPMLSETKNVFNDSNELQLAPWDECRPAVLGHAGWNYDPETGMIWANSDVTGENEL